MRIDEKLFHRGQKVRTQFPARLLRPRQRVPLKDRLKKRLRIIFRIVGLVSLIPDVTVNRKPIGFTKLSDGTTSLALVITARR